MKVIDPHFEILEDLDLQSLAVRIEACGRICYKSEDKISPESAEPFIRNIIKHGHNSVTEMAVLTLRIRYDSESFASQIFYLVPKFLHIDKVEKKELLVTGSVRDIKIVIVPVFLPVIQGIIAADFDVHIVVQF